MLFPRLLTAVFGIPLLLWLVHRGGLAFALLVVGVCGLCLYEYGVILLLAGKRPQRALLGLSGLALALCRAFGGPLELVLAACAAACALGELFSREHGLERMAAALFGAIFLGWMPAHLALLRDLRPHGERLTYMLFLAVWGCDSAAYLVGSAFGKHPLAARISPRKTWEGAAAGCLAAGLVVFAFRAASPGLLSVPRALLVAASIGILGQLSDLVESLIKRSLGAKDSGALLPGHGGMLDRFDSLLLAAPAVYYCLTL